MVSIVNVISSNLPFSRYETSNSSLRVINPEVAIQYSSKYLEATIEVAEMFPNQWMTGITYTRRGQGKFYGVGSSVCRYGTPLPLKEAIENQIESMVKSLRRSGDDKVADTFLKKHVNLLVCK